MSKSATPILDLEIAPPDSRRDVTIKGLLKALPVGLVIVGLIPAAIFVRFVLWKNPPNWTGTIFAFLAHFLYPLTQLQPLPAMASIWVGIWLVMLIHEAGHASAALILRWRILEFRAAPLSLKKLSGNLKFRVSWRAWPAGLVVADPQPIRFHSKLRLYALAGCAANFLAFVLIALTRPWWNSSSIAAALMIIEAWSVVMGLLNLLPIHLGNMEVDGYVAFVVSRTRKRLAVRLATLKLRNHILVGKPLEEVNPRWVALAEESGKASLQRIGGLWLAYSYWLEKDDYERAAPILERILAVSGRFAKEVKGVTYSECAVLQSFRKQTTAARTWEDRAKKFSQPGYINHRRSCCLAFMDGDLDRAYKEAELTKTAAMKLEDKAARDAFLAGWSRWMTEIEEKRTATKPLHSKQQLQMARSLALNPDR